MSDTSQPPPPVRYLIPAAMQELHAALGEAIAEWSQIERQLAIWFEIVSGMPAPMANGVFFAHNAFDSKMRVITEVFKHSSAAERDLEFTLAVFAKADAYSGFRNQLAHWVTHVDFRGTTTPTAMLVQPRGEDSAAKYAAGITAAHMYQASKNFSTLGQIMAAAHFEFTFQKQLARQTPLQELLQRVQQLPNEASSAQPGLNQSRRERQLQSAARKNAQKRSKP